MKLKNLLPEGRWDAKNEVGSEGYYKNPREHDDPPPSNDITDEASIREWMDEVLAVKVDGHGKKARVDPQFRTKYDITEQGVVVHRGLDLGTSYVPSRKMGRRLPVKIHKVDGNFSIHHQALRSWDNLPEIVNGHFSVQDNHLGQFPTDGARTVKCRSADITRNYCRSISNLHKYITSCGWLIADPDPCPALSLAMIDCIGELNFGAWDPWRRVSDLFQYMLKERKLFRDQERSHDVRTELMYDFQEAILDLPDNYEKFAQI